MRLQIGHAYLIHVSNWTRVLNTRVQMDTCIITRVHFGRVSKYTRPIGRAYLIRVSNWTRVLNTRVQFDTCIKYTCQFVAAV